MASQPDVLSFALGMPAADLFPAEALATASRTAVAHNPQALQYTLPHQPLKEHIVELMSERGVRCRAEQIFLTAGHRRGDHRPGQE